MFGVTAGTGFDGREIHLDTTNPLHGRCHDFQTGRHDFLADTVTRHDRDGKCFLIFH